MDNLPDDSPKTREEFNAWLTEELVDQAHALIKLGLSQDEAAWFGQGNINAIKCACAYYHAICSAGKWPENTQFTFNNLVAKTQLELDWREYMKNRKGE